MKKTLAALNKRIAMLDAKIEKAYDLIDKLKDQADEAKEQRRELLSEVDDSKKPICIIPKALWTYKGIHIRCEGAGQPLWFDSSRQRRSTMRASSLQDLCAKIDRWIKAGG